MRTRTMLISMVALAMTWLAASASLSATYIHKWTAFPDDGRIRVAAGNVYLAQIAREIGGDRVSVISLTKTDQDARNPKLYKSMVKAVAEADVLLRVDKNYDPWIEELVQRARSARIAREADWLVACFQGTSQLDTAKVEAGKLDPAYRKDVAANILAALLKAAPKDESYFKNNYEALRHKIDSAARPGQPSTNR
ncbi:MAG: metal ABC transporter substrate-binding protein [Armatimonadetes bacterium]|nr:metal ABC transporter substrate-binding protein [Armatimonadota bacterium]